MGSPEQLEAEVARLRGEVAALRATEARYESVIAAMMEGVVVQDATGAIVTCNHAAEEILGLTRDQLSGRSSLDPRWRAIHEDGTAFPGDTHPAMVTLRTGAPCRNVVMGVHKPDGHLSWISINSQPIASADPTAPHVVCTFTDITERKRALADLQASEARLQLAMRAARMGTWQWDIGDDRVLWSDTIGDLFGVPHEHFPRGFQGYLELVHPDDRAGVARELDAVMANAARDSFHVRHRVRAGRAERWLDCHGRAYRDAQGRVVRMAGVAIDVTDVHRLEQQVHQSQRLEAIGRLAGGIAHDFNNVLTVVLSTAELRLRSGGDATEDLAIIRDAASRAAQLTSQLLAFARQRPAGVASVDLGALLAALRPLLARLLGERIALEVAIAPGAWVVRADASQLEQVLINLVANARDAVRDTGRVRVSLGGVAGSDEVALAVEDDGVGMSPEVVDRVFEPFYTTKSSGTGLGLATCYGIVNQHGGHIVVNSAIGVGTRVEVRLLRQGPADAARAPVVHGVASDPALPRGQETVLVVEDDERVRKVAQRILADHGYRVLVAANGAEALALVERHGSEVGAVLTDAVMPRMGGAELARQLRARWPELPILVISGYDPPEGPGVDALPRLDKPYTPAQLLACVREVLDRVAS